MRDERKIELFGSLAAEWMVGVGWEVISNVSEFRVYADVVQRGGFTMGRIWHTPAALKFHSRDPRDALALVGVLGEQVVSVGQTSQVLRAGHGGVFAGGQVITVASGAPVARIFMTTVLDRLLAQGLRPDQLNVVQLDSSSIYQAYVGAVNASLNAPTLAHGGTYSMWRRGVEALFAAAVSAGRSDQAAGSQSRKHETLQRALEFIDSTSTNPELTVPRLAEMLNVSESHLHASFVETGRTAGQSITLARARTARALRDGPGATALTSRKIAELAGFGSVRSMSRALNLLARVED